MASLLSRLAPKGYPGQIFVLKLRYGYGSQKIIEKLEILDNWYSDLQAYLPELYSKDDAKKDEYNETFHPMLEDVVGEINAAYDIYDGVFEDATCSPTEKRLLKAMRGIKYRLDTITAKSKILDGMNADEGSELMAG
jgi:hypothetical protein